MLSHSASSTAWFEREEIVRQDKQDLQDFFLGEARTDKPATGTADRLSLAVAPLVPANIGNLTPHMDQ